MSTEMIDVCSLNFMGNEWECDSYTLSSSEEAQFHGIKLEDVSGFSRRFSGALQFGFCQDSDSCRVRITPLRARRGVGCRMVGTIISQLADHPGGIGQLPATLYLEAGRVEEDQSEDFKIRSLLTLSGVCTRTSRKRICSTFSTSFIPALPSEGFGDYEKRVVELIGHELGSEYKRLSTKELKLKKVQSEPDGLFFNAAKNETLIVEIKKTRRNTDGITQAIQYYGQAINHDKFRRSTICTRLITEVHQETHGYKIWKDLIRSDKDHKILIARSNVKGVHVKELNG